MRRRQFLRIAGASGLWLTVTGHSPYRQWDVYRKVRLVLLVSADEADAVRLANELAALYAKRLPESRATVARARDKNDLVRLIVSKQLEIALMLEADAYALMAGAEPFADSGKVPINVIASLGAYLLVCREDLARASAYMLAEAAAERWSEIDSARVGGARSPRPGPGVRVPVHPGAAEYYQDHG